MEEQVEKVQKNIYAGMVWKHKDKILVSIALICLAFWLLGEDSRTFFSWWLLIWVMGCCFMPLTGMLFSKFRDKGWMFSEVLAIAISGYATWLLVTLGILKFTSFTCLIVTLFCIGANFVLAFYQGKKTADHLPGLQKTGNSYAPRDFFWKIFSSH